ncbi:MAG: AAA family ATPase [Lachnospiraceae bacterium]|nr:AAA family ATPase [Lachnospiraceae bacterium]
MKKIVIIINGVGGAGKDTLCDYVSAHIEAVNVSSITPIKDIAQNYGWDGEKTESSRKFLADLKRTFIDFNDLPTEYLLGEYEKFTKGTAEIFFAHIREAAEIEKFKERIKGMSCVTLLIRRGESISWGNSADDEVEKYAYDYYFDNDKELGEAEVDFCSLVLRILNDNS